MFLFQAQYIYQDISLQFWYIQCLSDCSGSKFSVSLPKWPINRIFQLTVLKYILWISGDNDLRPGDNEDYKFELTDPDELYEIFKYLLTEAKKIENVVVLLCSMLPSIENQQHNECYFLEMDERLKLLVDSPSNLIHFSKSFRNSVGQIKRHLYQDDGVHLNPEGTDVMAKQIFNYVMRIRKDRFQ